jgi:hypothetical protein
MLLGSKLSALSCANTPVAKSASATTSTIIVRLFILSGSPSENLYPINWPCTGTAR